MGFPLIQDALNYQDKQIKGKDPSLLFLKKSGWHVTCSIFINDGERNEFYY
jgi:hypothetical protein